MTSCQAGQKNDRRGWQWHDVTEDGAPFSPGASARLVVVPLEIWRAAVGVEEGEGESDIAVSVARVMGFQSATPPLEVLHARLFDKPAWELRGRRTEGRWGSVVILLDGPNLVLFESILPNRSRFLRFQPTWRRMVSRASRMSPHQS
jgi:hypothetical protein